MAGKRESRRIFDTVQILPRPREARQNASSVCQTRSCTEPRLMGQVHLNFHKVWHVTQNVGCLPFGIFIHVREKRGFSVIKLHANYLIVLV